MVVMLVEWVFTSAFLIFVVLALRAALGKRVSARLCYALWAVVLVRLLVPVQLFTSPLAGTRIFSESRMEQDVVDWPSVHAAPNAPDNALSPGGQGGQTVNFVTAPQAPNPPTLPDAPEPPAAPDLTRAPAWLGWVWLAGSAAVALVLLTSNLWFYWKLRRERIPLEIAGCPLRVYAAVGLPSPCLFGLFRSAIYVTPEAAADPDMLRHVIAHEYTHYRQGDHFWSLLRCVALAAHWWNPLVWLAAVFSQRDAELACDEGALKRLGDGERAGYGSTLLALVTAKPRPGDLFRCATTMAGDKKSLKERISRIACAPKRILWAAVAAVLVTVLACVCAFGQAEPVEPSDDVDEFIPTYTMNGDRNVLIEGLSGAYVEWSRGTNGGALYFTSGMAAYCCPKLAGETVEGSAYWEDVEKSILHVRLNVDDGRIEDGTVDGFGIDFTVDLNSDIFLRREFTSELGDGTIELTDQEMLDMARVLAKLLTEAEDYYNSQNAAESEAQILEYCPDLNRNGVPESLRVSGTREKMRLEVWEDDELIYDEEGYFAHAGWNAVFLCTLDGKDYLLRYHPTMYQGYCNYEYQLFTLSKSGEEQMIQENSIEFDINFVLMHQSFDPEAIAAFMDEINGLLDNSVQLINTDDNLLSAFVKENRLYDSLWFLDTWEPVFTRDESKSLLENLREFKEAMEVRGDGDGGYASVLLGRSQFILREPFADSETVNERHANIADVPAVFDPYDTYMKLWNFAVVDLDGDGTDEVLVYACGVAGDMGGYLLLHQEAGNVYGMAFNSTVSGHSCFLELKTDGTFKHLDPTGTDWMSITRIRFRSTVYIIDDLAFASTSDHGDFDSFLVDHQKATKAEFEAVLAAQDAKPDAVWYDFTEENIYNVFLKG